MEYYGKVTSWPKECLSGSKCKFQAKMMSHSWLSMKVKPSEPLNLTVVSFLLFFFFAFLGLYPLHMEVSQARGRIGTTAASIRNNHSNTRSHTTAHGKIINPLIKAWNWTRRPMVPSRIHFHCATTGTPRTLQWFLNKLGRIWCHHQTWRV